MYEECNLCGVAHEPSDFVDCNHRLSGLLLESQQRNRSLRQAAQLKEKYVMGLVEKIMELSERDAFLSCLEACGVDNWEGYDGAQEMMEESHG